ncbi:MAG: nucleoside deaminase [Cytophagaceae bacterium]|jgi:tRNA(adenine34) deaminase|nr:nucleoside deaminase [Cytophagaceae bacterium]
MLELYTDDFFMNEALKEARYAMEEGEIPVGAVVVSNNRIIARSHNQTEALTDVTAHAEMLAITSAANHLGSKYLHQCTLYVTLEPCVMCAGALYWSQVSRIVFAASDEKSGFSRFGNLFHPKTQVMKGIKETEASALLKTFFKGLRE